jgi:UDP-N-acetylmuramyl pentapeptide synthase
LICFFGKGRDVSFTKEALQGKIDAFIFEDDLQLFNKLKYLAKKGDAILFKGSRA